MCRNSARIMIGHLKNSKNFCTSSLSVTNSLQLGLPNLKHCFHHNSELYKSLLIMILSSKLVETWPCRKGNRFSWWLIGFMGVCDVTWSSTLWWTSFLVQNTGLSQLWSYNETDLSQESWLWAQTLLNYVLLERETDFCSDWWVSWVSVMSLGHWVANVLIKFTSL